MTLQITTVDAEIPVALELLAAIHAAAFAPMDERGWAGSELRAMMEMPGAYLQLAQIEGEPVGFILYRVVLDEAELITVAILPDRQRQGIALRLIGQMVDQLKKIGVSRIFLEVRDDNDRAIALYRRFGFSDAGRRSRYYQTQSGNRIDALCLCLFLNNSPEAKEK